MQRSEVEIVLREADSTEDPAEARSSVIGEEFRSFGEIDSSSDQADTSETAYILLQVEVVAPAKML